MNVSAATLTGSGYTISRSYFPAYYEPESDGNAARCSSIRRLRVQPTASLTLTSNSSSGTSTVISLSSTGVPVLSGLSCTSGSMTGAGTDSCTVTLNVAAASGGVAVSLASNNTAVTVPASVTVAAGSTTGSFTATVTAVSTAQTVTLTASANSVVETFALQLGSSVPTLTLSAGSIRTRQRQREYAHDADTDIVLDRDLAVTVSAGTVAGTGFTVWNYFPDHLEPQSDSYAHGARPTNCGCSQRLIDSDQQFVERNLNVDQPKRHGRARVERLPHEGEPRGGNR